MSKILVTGGAGFIGSHLCDYLLNNGDDVLCVDNLFSGGRDNIRHLLGHPYFEFIRHDVIHPFFAEVDQIYHLACPASPIYYQYNPIKTIKTNVMGTINMLGLAKRVMANILLASTSEVYGNPMIHPQQETYWGNTNPIGERSCYDEGKRVAETLMMDYHRQNQVDIKIVRIFNTYGTRMAINDGRVISNFIVQALRGEALAVFGNGAQTRSFCYISDLIEGIVRMMETDDCIGPVNLGNPVELSILEIANKILLITESQSKIIFKPLPPDDPERRCPDIALAKKILKWTPTVSLDEGLEKTIGYFKEKLGIKR
ncbi:MAG: SDR family oxidoreductase [Deltaproteobacteria bacterium]|nr:SDR family oxidoreductase [Deltaproteobacteria bacterium]